MLIGLKPRPHEVFLEGCTFRDLATGAPRDVRIQDSSPRTSFVNIAGRIRLPQISDQELAAWPDSRAGDLAWSTTLGRVVVYDGTNWRVLDWT